LPYSENETNLQITKQILKVPQKCQSQYECDEKKVHLWTKQEHT